MCSLVYVIHLDALERHFHTAALSAATYRAAGAEKVDLPDWAKVRADFDADLAAEPVEERRDTKTVMLRALGLR